MLLQLKLTYVVYRICSFHENTSIFKKVKRIVQLITKLAMLRSDDKLPLFLIHNNMHCHLPKNISFVAKTVVGGLLLCLLFRKLKTIVVPTTGGHE